MSPNVLHDMVPASVRSEWVASGYYPNKDVYSLFHEWVVSYPDRIAVIDEAASTTYGALDIKVRRVAAAFREAGVEPGDVVGVQLPNSWQACAVELALAAVGAIALPYPVGRAERDVCSMLGRSEAVAAVICGSYGGKDHRAMLDGIRRDLPHLTTVFVLEDEGDTPIADPSSLNAVLADRAADGRWGPLPISPDGPVRMVVTSGTEAAPKMVAYSHNALAGGRGNFVGALAGDCNPMRSFFLVPMGSAFGSSATSVSLARHGATLILCAKFAPDPVINLIERHRPTHLWGVAAMFDMLLTSPKLEAADVSSVSVVAIGGSALAPSTIDSVRERLGARVVNVWGTGDGANCHTKLDDPPEKVSSTVGQPNPAVADIRIVDDNNEPVPVGTQGEICALGPMSAMCYYNCPELDKEYRVSGGWVKTGDLGVIDSDGYLRVLGRKKDVIIRGGENISPATIESALQVHPDVLHAACVGMPDARLGERICAFLVLQSGSQAPSLDEMSRFLLEERGLSTSSLPERLELLAEMPFNPAGKILKRDLRDLIAREVLQERHTP